MCAEPGREAVRLMYEVDGGVSTMMDDGASKLGRRHGKSYIAGGGSAADRRPRDAAVET